MGMSKDCALRQLAARVAAILPEDRNDAARVLQLSGEIYSAFIQPAKRPRLASSNNLVSLVGSPERT
jgi:hypothetical protein